MPGRWCIDRGALVEHIVNWPVHVVIDTTDGRVLWKGRTGRFTAQTAAEFAARRNAGRRGEPYQAAQIPQRLTDAEITLRREVTLARAIIRRIHPTIAVAPCADQLNRLADAAEAVLPEQPGQ